MLPLGIISTIEKQSLHSVGAFEFHANNLGEFYYKNIDFYGGGESKREMRQRNVFCILLADWIWEAILLKGLTILFCSDD
jgi:hypothetical protein